MNDKLIGRNPVREAIKSERDIDKILVTNEGSGIARLDIKIFTGKSTEAWLTKLGRIYEVRTGHILKKMVESYENSLGANNTTK